MVAALSPASRAVLLALSEAAEAKSEADDANSDALPFAWLVTWLAMFDIVSLVRSVAFDIVSPMLSAVRSAASLMRLMESSERALRAFGPHEPALRINRAAPAATSSSPSGFCLIERNSQSPELDIVDCRFMSVAPSLSRSLVSLDGCCGRV